MQESMIREDKTHGYGEPADSKVILLSTISEIMKSPKLTLTASSNVAVYRFCVIIVCYQLHSWSKYVENTFNYSAG